MGKKILAVPIRHEHVRSSTYNSVDPEMKKRVSLHNHIVFMDKWGRYLQNRSFTNKILVRMVSDGIGDVLLTTSVIPEIRKEHPTAEIIIETNHPEVFASNTNINGTVKPNERKREAVDRFIDLSPVNYGSYEPIPLMMSRIAKVKVENLTPQIFLSNRELDVAYKLVKPEGRTAIGFALQMRRVNWKGRNWNHDYAEALIRHFTQNFDCETVELGKDVKSTKAASIDLVDKTSLRELFSVIANLDFLFCIDSLALHVAQAFDVPTLALFGATEPVARVLNWNCVVPVMNKTLSCSGCYNKKGSPAYNHCFLGIEECMLSLTPEIVFDAYENFNVGNNMFYLQHMLRQLLWK